MAAVILDAQPRSEPHPKRRRIRSPYPVAWSLHPGDPGFARYVEGVIQAAGLPALLRCSSPADDLPRDQWYQTILRWLVHPYTPVRRLLVAWQLGSGKTIGMIIALSNYYEDPRPKVVVVPTEDLVTNFYRALLATDNPYRRWLHSVDPTLGPNSVGRAQQLLERASGGSGTPAPLRAFRYTLAGGRTLLRSPLMAFGPSHWREARRKNPLSHTVVVCDEAHNIVQPPDDIFNKLQVKTSTDSAGASRTPRWPLWSCLRRRRWWLMPPMRRTCFAL
jgi:hypothetical protein